MPMTDIAHTEPATSLAVWECECGSQSFFITHRGDIVCEECEAASQSLSAVFMDSNAPGSLTEN